MGIVKGMKPEKGDEVLIEWDETDEKATAKAKKRIKQLLDKPGIRVYRVDKIHGRRIGEELLTEEEFDPTAPEYLVTPAVAGG